MGYGSIFLGGNPVEAIPEGMHCPANRLGVLWNLLKEWRHVLEIIQLDTLLLREERGEVTSNRPLSSRPRSREREREREGSGGRGEVKEVECVRMGF